MRGITKTVRDWDKRTESEMTDRHQDKPVQGEALFSLENGIKSPGEQGSIFPEQFVIKSA